MTDNEMRKLCFFPTIWTVMTLTFPRAGEWRRSYINHCHLCNSHLTACSVFCRPLANIYRAKPLSARNVLLICSANPVLTETLLLPGDALYQFMKCDTRYTVTERRSGRLVEHTKHSTPLSDVSILRLMCWYTWLLFQVLTTFL